MLLFPHKNSETGRLQTCNLQYLAAKGKKWHEMIPYREGSPLPLPQAPGQNQRTPKWTPSFWIAETLAASYLNQPQVCLCTHTKVFSKPAAAVYCFPSRQLAVKLLIQQLLLSANSALRTLSARTSEKPNRGFKWPALVHFTFESLILFTLMLATCSYKHLHEIEEILPHNLGFSRNE